MFIHLRELRNFLFYQKAVLASKKATDEKVPIKRLKSEEKSKISTKNNTIFGVQKLLFVCR